MARNPTDRLLNLITRRLSPFVGKINGVSTAGTLAEGILEDLRPYLRTTEPVSVCHENCEHHWVAMKTMPDGPVSDTYCRKCGGAYVD